MQLLLAMQVLDVLLVSRGLPLCPLSPATQEVLEPLDTFLDVYCPELFLWEMEEGDRDGSHGEGRDGRRGKWMVAMGRGEMEEGDRDGSHGEGRDGGGGQGW